MKPEKKIETTLDEIINHLQRVRSNLNLSDIAHLIREVDSANNIFVYGAGRSGYVARAFAQRLMQIGYKAHFIGETSTPSAGKGDLLVLVTGSGSTPSGLTILRTAKKLGMRRFVITAKDDGEAAKDADLVLNVEGKTKLLERKTHAPFTSLFDIATLSVLDAVTAVLMLERGLSDDDIGAAHANLE